MHELDLLRYFMGDVAKVFCQGGISTRGFEVEETGAVVLSFKNGAVGTFIFSDAVASPCSWEGASAYIYSATTLNEVVLICLIQLERIRIFHSR